VGLLALMSVQHWCNDADRANPSTGKKLYNKTLFATFPTQIVLDLNPSLHGEKAGDKSCEPWHSVTPVSMKYKCCARYIHLFT